MFSLGLVGIFERLLRSSRTWVRWLADSSYWIYIVHLPVVTFLTFYLAHLDRQGRLEYLTGFSWSAELKFLAACVVTTVLGVGDVSVPGSVHTPWHTAEREEERDLVSTVAATAGAVR